MKFRCNLVVACLLFGCLAFAGRGTHAQGDNEGLVKPPQAAGDPSLAETPIPEKSIANGDLNAGLQDPSFDRFVDLAELGNALEERSAGRIADVALQLAEGERILLRPHRAITADKVFQLAVRIASETKDSDTLDRLGRAARQLKNDELQVLIDAARKVAGAARAAGPMISIDPNGDLSGLIAYQNFLGEIERARSVHDRGALQALEEGLGNGPVMDEKLTKYLASRIADALRQLPEQPTAEDELLQQLSASNRGASGDGSEDVRAGVPPQITPAFVNSLPGENRSIFNFCRANFLKKVGDGQCASLDKAAIENAIRRTFRITGNPRADDYVWGNRIGTITPRQYGISSRILPGDLLQYRDVVFKGSRRVGNGTYTYTSTATHHSAVVMAVTDNGATIHVFQENSGGMLYVTHGYLHLNDMQSGTIWVYRAN